MEQDTPTAAPVIDVCRPIVHAKEEWVNVDTQPITLPDLS